MCGEDEAPTEGCLVSLEVASHFPDFPKVELLITMLCSVSRCRLRILYLGMMCPQMATLSTLRVRITFRRSC